MRRPFHTSRRGNSTASLNTRSMRLEPLENRQLLAVYSVDNLDDSGAGSLRAAITAANLSTGTPDAITFSVTGTINIASQLPTISDALTITGPGANLLKIDAGNGADHLPSTVDGFGVFSTNNSSGPFELKIRDLTITGGDSGSRGGAIVNRVNLTLTDCNIVGNSAFDVGGGIYNSGTMTITGSTISGNSSNFSKGGAIYSYGGTMTISGSAISGNSATYGGGIFSVGGTTTITGSTISGNAVSRDGGGIANLASAMTITSSTIAVNYSRHGGGIFNYGTATITNSTISKNSASGQGGGINNFYTATITNSTISGNSANEGGGILNLTTANITGSLITGNMAPTGSEIRRVSGTVNLNAFNLIGESSKTTAQALSGVLTGPNDILATSDGPTPTALSAILAPRANNGGPTETHALVAGSPAINSGNPGFTTPPDFDQRGTGYKRVVNGRIDIGALEVQAPSADFDGDGDVDGRDFLAWQRGFGTPAPTAVKAQGDADNDLDVDGPDLAVWQGQYGTGSLVAEVERISDLGFMVADGEDEGSGSREPLSNMAPWAVSLSSTTRDGVPCYDDVAHENSYVEQVDRALEQLEYRGDKPLGSLAVAPSGQMVARRETAKTRVGVESL